ncbi:transcriptional regulator, XRE family [Rhodovulum sp. PH10]|uniref:helix-turn-helix domain-containing protein n=1 Tax=Rhodovulum sp. PH10 TaxID=1187851 RepID=UPI00027C2163|nr:helix-turn-helix transcriptional regulator [Rhodovulum sp. PH10]EJW13148.1 transcriptional regulator, XRE family [Rhodovulum sp. PH10]
MTKVFEESSGNVFADLGFADSARELTKAELTVEIHRLLVARKTTQSEAAALLGTTQPQVSALMRCKPTSISIGRLIEFLTILGRDVEITVKPTTRRGDRAGTGRMSVVVQPVATGE